MANTDIASPACGRLTRHSREAIYRPMTTAAFTVGLYYASLT